MAPESVRRLSYYAAALMVGILVHQDVTSSLLGSTAGDLLRRNSEAYALFFVPAYWDLFASRTQPDGSGGTQAIGPSWFGQGLWFLILATIALVLPMSFPAEFGIVLPQSIVTLREAMLALVLVSAYLGWSRSILPLRPHMIDGTATRTATSRALYYVLVSVLAAAAHLGWVREVAGSGAGDWFETNIEAYAAMLLIPAYFDLITPTRSRWVRPVWYLCLVMIPILVQGGILGRSHPPRSLFDWIGRATEGFIAAFVVSAYFDFWRTPSHSDGPT